MENKNFRYFEFDDFKVDLRRRILTRNNEIVPLSPRNFELLLFLIENEGRILSHDELLDAVWEGAFVEQSNLKTAISILRGALGESPSQSLFIKTIPRKGYSFVSPVRALPDDSFTETVWLHRTDTQIIVEEEIEEDEDNEDVSAALAPSAKTPALLIAKAPAAPESSIFSFLKRHRLIAAALILLFGGAVAVAGWRLIVSRAASSAIDLSWLQIVPLTNLGNVGGGNISRNGEYLYFGMQERSRLSSIWIKNLHTGEVRQLLPPQKINVYASGFAPDSRSIYLWLSDDKSPERNGVYQIGVEGGELHKVTDKEWAGFHFSPDGGRVAYCRYRINEQNESGLFTAKLDGSDEKLIFRSDGKLSFLSVDWSPDGRFLTYVARRIADNQNQYIIARIPESGGAAEPEVIASRPQSIFSAYWMPDGKGLAVTALDESSKVQQIWYLSYPGGQWQRITNDLNWYWAANPTADGKGISVVQGHDLCSLWAGDGDGQNFRQITFDTFFYQPDVTWLDDETVLFAARTGDNNEIWEMSADGKNRRQLTFDAGNDRFPQAAAGGERILFLSDRSGMTQVWQMRRDGSDAKQITSASANVGAFSILPDGRTIVYAMLLPDRGWSLFKKPVDGDNFQALPFSNATSTWSISPDGSEIAYLAQTKTGERVRVSPLEENKLIKEFDLGDFNRLVWTTDGKALLHDGLYNNYKEIILQPIDGAAPRVLTNFNSEGEIWNFDLSPGGKRIVARRVRQMLDVMLIKLDSN